MIMMVSILLGVIGPLLPRLAREEHSNFFASLVAGGHPLGSLIGAIPAVLLARRFGLPKVIIIGALVMGSSTILFVFPGHGYWIIVGRIGHGFGAAFIWQSIFAWLVSNVGPAHRARAIGFLLGASTLGGLLAPQIGALSTAALLILCSAYFIRVPPYDFAERTPVKEITRAFSSRLGLAGIALSGATALVAVGFSTEAPLLLGSHGFRPFQISFVLTLGSGFMIFFNPLAGRLLDRGHTKLLLVGSFSIASLALLFLANTHSFYIITFLCLCIIILLGISSMPGGVMVSQTMHENQIDQTVSQSISSLIWAPNAIAGSLLMGSLGGPRIALVVLAILVGGFALLLGIDSHWQRAGSTKS
jgi:MFS family permease